MDRREELRVAREARRAGLLGGVPVLQQQQEEEAAVAVALPREEDRRGGGGGGEGGSLSIRATGPAPTEARKNVPTMSPSSSSSFSRSSPKPVPCAGSPEASAPPSAGVQSKKPPKGGEDTKPAANQRVPRRREGQKDSMTAPAEEIPSTGPPVSPSSSPPPPSGVLRQRRRSLGSMITERHPTTALGRRMEARRATREFPSDFLLTRSITSSAMGSGTTSSSPLPSSSSPPFFPSPRDGGEGGTSPFPPPPVATTTTTTATLRSGHPLSQREAQIRQTYFDATWMRPSGGGDGEWGASSSSSSTNIGGGVGAHGVHGFGASTTSFSSSASGSGGVGGGGGGAMWMHRAANTRFNTEAHVTQLIAKTNLNFMEMDAQVSEEYRVAQSVLQKSVRDSVSGFSVLFQEVDRAAVLLHALKGSLYTTRALISAQASRVGVAGMGKGKRRKTLRGDGGGLGVGEAAGLTRRGQSPRRAGGGISLEWERGGTTSSSGGGGPFLFGAGTGGGGREEPTRTSPAWAAQQRRRAFYVVPSTIRALCNPILPGESTAEDEGHDIDGGEEEWCWGASGYFTAGVSNTAVLLGRSRRRGRGMGGGGGGGGVLFFTGGVENSTIGNLEEEERGGELSQGIAGGEEQRKKKKTVRLAPPSGVEAGGGSLVLSTSSSFGVPEGSGSRGVKKPREVSASRSSILPSSGGSRTSRPPDLHRSFHQGVAGGRGVCARPTLLSRRGMEQGRTRFGRSRMDLLGGKGGEEEEEEVALEEEEEEEKREEGWSFVNRSLPLAPSPPRADLAGGGGGARLGCVEHSSLSRTRKEEAEEGVVASTTQTIPPSKRIQLFSHRPTACLFPSPFPPVEQHEKEAAPCHATNEPFLRSTTAEESTEETALHHAPAPPRGRPSLASASSPLSPLLLRDLRQRLRAAWTCSPSSSSTSSSSSSPTSLTKATISWTTRRLNVQSFSCWSAKAMDRLEETNAASLSYAAMPFSTIAAPSSPFPLLEGSLTWETSAERERRSKLQPPPHHQDEEEVTGAGQDIQKRREDSIGLDEASPSSWSAYYSFRVFHVLQLLSSPSITFAKEAAWACRQQRRQQQAQLSRLQAFLQDELRWLLTTHRFQDAIEVLRQVLYLQKGQEKKKNRYLKAFLEGREGGRDGGEARGTTSSAFHTSVVVSSPKSSSSLAMFRLPPANPYEDCLPLLLELEAMLFHAALHHLYHRFPLSSVFMESLQIPFIQSLLYLGEPGNASVRYRQGLRREKKQPKKVPAEALHDTARGGHRLTTDEMALSTSNVGNRSSFGSGTFASWVNGPSTCGPGGLLHQGDGFSGIRSSTSSSSSAVASRFPFFLASTSFPTTTTTISFRQRRAATLYLKLESKRMYSAWRALQAQLAGKDPQNGMGIRSQMDFMMSSIRDAIHRQRTLLWPVELYQALTFGATAHAEADGKAHEGEDTKRGWTTLPPPPYPPLLPVSTDALLWVRERVARYASALIAFSSSGGEEGGGGGGGQGAGMEEEEEEEEGEGEEEERGDEDPPTSFASHDPHFLEKRSEASSSNSSSSRGGGIRGGPQEWGLVGSPSRATSRAVPPPLLVSSSTAGGTLAAAGGGATGTVLSSLHVPMVLEPARRLRRAVRVTTALLEVLRRTAEDYPIFAGGEAVVRRVVSAHSLVKLQVEWMSRVRHRMNFLTAAAMTQCFSDAMEYYYYDAIPLTSSTMTLSHAKRLFPEEKEEEPIPNAEEKGALKSPPLKREDKKKEEEAHEKEKVKWLRLLMSGGKVTPTTTNTTTRRRMRPQWPAAPGSSPFDCLRPSLPLASEDASRVGTVAGLSLWAQLRRMTFFLPSSSSVVLLSLLCSPASSLLFDRQWWRMIGRTWEWFRLQQCDDTLLEEEKEAEEGEMEKKMEGPVELLSASTAPPLGMELSSSISQRSMTSMQPSPMSFSSPLAFLKATEVLLPPEQFAFLRFANSLSPVSSQLFSSMLSLLAAITGAAQVPILYALPHFTGPTVKRSILSLPPFPLAPLQGGNTMKKMHRNEKRQRLMGRRGDEVSPRLSLRKGSPISPSSPFGRRTATTTRYKWLSPPHCASTVLQSELFTNSLDGCLSHLLSGYVLQLGDERDRLLVFLQSLLQQKGDESKPTRATPSISRADIRAPIQADEEDEDKAGEKEEETSEEVWKATDFLPCPSGLSPRGRSSRRMMAPMASPPLFSHFTQSPAWVLETALGCVTDVLGVGVWAHYLTLGGGITDLLGGGGTVGGGGGEEEALHDTSRSKGRPGEGSCDAREGGKENVWEQLQRRARWRYRMGMSCRSDPRGDGGGGERMGFGGETCASTPLSSASSSSVDHAFFFHTPYLSILQEELLPEVVQSWLAFAWGIGLDARPASLSLLRRGLQQHLLVDRGVTNTQDGKRSSSVLDTTMSSMPKKEEQHSTVVTAGGGGGEGSEQGTSSSPPPPPSPHEGRSLVALFHESTLSTSSPASSSSSALSSSSFQFLSYLRNRTVKRASPTRSLSSHGKSHPDGRNGKKDTPEEEEAYRKSANGGANQAHGRRDGSRAPSRSNSVSPAVGPDAPPASTTPSSSTSPSTIRKRRGSTASSVGRDGRKPFASPPVSSSSSSSSAGLSLLLAPVVTHLLRVPYTTPSYYRIHEYLPFSSSRPPSCAVTSLSDRGRRGEGCGGSRSHPTATSSTMAVIQPHVSDVWSRASMAPSSSRAPVEGGKGEGMEGKTNGASHPEDHGAVVDAGTRSTTTFPPVRPLTSCGSFWTIRLHLSRYPPFPFLSSSSSSSPSSLSFPLDDELFLFHWISPITLQLLTCFQERLLVPSYVVNKTYSQRPTSHTKEDLLCSTSATPRGSSTTYKKRTDSTAEEDENENEENVGDDDEGQTRSRASPPPSSQRRTRMGKPSSQDATTASFSSLKPRFPIPSGLIPQEPEGRLSFLSGGGGGGSYVASVAMLQFIVFHVLKEGLCSLATWNTLYGSGPSSTHPTSGSETKSPPMHSRSSSGVSSTISTSRLRPATAIASPSSSSTAHALPSSPCTTTTTPLTPWWRREDRVLRQQVFALGLFIRMWSPLFRDGLRVPLGSEGTGVASAPPPPPSPSRAGMGSTTTPLHGGHVPRAAAAGSSFSSGSSSPLTVGGGSEGRPLPTPPLSLSSSLLKPWEKPAGGEQHPPHGGGGGENGATRAGAAATAMRIRKPSDIHIDGIPPLWILQHLTLSSSTSSHASPPPSPLPPPPPPPSTGAGGGAPALLSLCSGSFESFAGTAGNKSEASPSWMHPSTRCGQLGSPSSPSSASYIPPVLLEVVEDFFHHTLQEPRGMLALWASRSRVDRALRTINLKTFEHKKAILSDDDDDDDDEDDEEDEEDEDDEDDEDDEEEGSEVSHHRRQGVSGGGQSERRGRRKLQKGAKPDSEGEVPLTLEDLREMLIAYLLPLL